MLLHDPSRYGDNLAYWKRTVAFLNSSAVYISDVKEDCTIRVVNDRGETVDGIPMSSPDLSVNPILAQFKGDRLIQSVAQRRRRKGIQFDIHSHAELKLLTQCQEIGEVTQYLDGYAYIFNTKHKRMTPEQYNEFKKEFVCP